MALLGLGHILLYSGYGQVIIDIGGVVGVLVPHRAGRSPGRAARLKGKKMNLLRVIQISFDDYFSLCISINIGNNWSIVTCQVCQWIS